MKVNVEIVEISPYTMKIVLVLLHRTISGETDAYLFWKFFSMRGEVQDAAGADLSLHSFT